jgi:hypothetical protein
MPVLAGLVRVPPSIDAIAEEYVDRTAVPEPLMSTYAGIPGHDHELPDLSADSWVQRVRQIFDVMPADGEQAAVNIARRLAVVSTAQWAFPATSCKYARPRRSGRT